MSSRTLAPFRAMMSVQAFGAPVIVTIGTDWRMMELSTLTPWIKQAATSTYRAYSQWTTFPDVEAQLWLWATENEARVVDYLNHAEGERIIRSILNQEARKYAIKERASVTGYSTDDLTWYSHTMIKKILPDVFDYEDWQTFSTGGDGRGSKPVANATGDRLATILDVKGALAKLTKDQVLILKEHYGRGASIEACAIVLGISHEAARKRVDRAVYAIRDKLNGQRQTDPYEAVNGQFDTRTSGRKVMSNAAARKATEANWGE